MVREHGETAKQIIENDGTGTRRHISLERIYDMTFLTHEQRKAIENSIPKDFDKIIQNTINNLCSAKDIQFETVANFTENNSSILEEVYKRTWRKFSDDWFTYYVNVTTGEKKLNLEKGDIEIQ